MNKRLSNTDNVKKLAMQKQKEKNALRDMFSQMVFDEAWYKRQRNQLLKDIDTSLDERNYEKFMELTAKYKDLMKSW